MRQRTVKHSMISKLPLLVAACALMVSAAQAQSASEPDASRTLANADAAASGGGAGDDESTYDWTNEQWTVPVNLMVQQLVKIGKQPVALVVGGRYYADKPEDGPDWGLRFAVIPLFPKK